MRLIVALVCLGIAGCGINPNEAEELRSKIAKLETEIALLEYGPGTEQERLKDLEDRLKAVEATMDPEYALLTPGGSGYSVAKTRLGPILVSLGDMEVRGKGSRVEISLGNMSAAQIQGADLTIGYSADRNSPKAEDVHVARHSHLGMLMPGTWSTASVNLPELKPDELEEIRVLVGVDVVQMR